MKTFLPWVLVVALFAGIYFLFNQIKERDAQIARLSQDSSELAQVRAENDELKKNQVQLDELNRLRKEHDELLRLRNESQRTHDQVKQLAAQLAEARSQSDAEQAQSEKMAQLSTENQNLRNQAEQRDAETKTAAAQSSTCVNNLRLIDQAKQQWALEYKKSATDVPTAADLAPYLTNPNQIVCPAGGNYSINAVGAPATCSVPSHNVPR